MTDIDFSLASINAGDKEETEPPEGSTIDYTMTFETPGNYEDSPSLFDAGVSSRSIDSYADARNGLDDVVKVAGTHYVGQMKDTIYDNPPRWYIWESLLSFVLSGIPSSFTLISAKLLIYKSTLGTMDAITPFNLEVRHYDYGETIEAGDFIVGDNLGSYPLMGTYSVNWTSSTPSGWQEVSLDISEITLGETLQLLLSSDRTRLNQMSSSYSTREYWRIPTKPIRNNGGSYIGPKLVLNGELCLLPVQFNLCAIDSKIEPDTIPEGHVPFHIAIIAEDL